METNGHTPGWRTLRTRVGRYDMHTRASAPPAPSGSPVYVLVHGVGVSGRYMMPTARLLARDHAVYVPDLPGFGKSCRPSHALDICELADALAGWAEALGLPRAVYLANSLGCQVVLDFAARYPRHVECAVLVGPTGDPEAQTLVQMISRGVLDLIGERLSLLPILVTDYLSAGPLRCLRTLQHALTDPLLSKLPTVLPPTLALRGAFDPIAPRRWVERMAALLPRGRSTVLPHAPHAANYSTPEELAHVVRAFVAEEASRRACPGGLPGGINPPARQAAP
jgi:2-hydroxy-6-oxonona-2,4-dienedioate hydrolase